MELDVRMTNEFVDQILELSADAHIRRRAAIKNSPEYHNLTGAITAYGTMLALFTALQRVQEFCAEAPEQPLAGCAQPNPPWVS